MMEDEPQTSIASKVKRELIWFVNQLNFTLRGRLSFSRSCFSARENEIGSQPPTVFFFFKLLRLVFWISRVSVTSWIAISYGSIEKSNGSLHGMSRNTTTDWIPTTSFRSQKKLASRTWLLNVILGISTLVGQWQRNSGTITITNRKYIGIFSNETVNAKQSLCTIRSHNTRENKRRRRKKERIGKLFVEMWAGQDCQNQYSLPLPSHLIFSYFSFFSVFPSSPFMDH